MPQGFANFGIGTLAIDVPHETHDAARDPAAVRALQLRRGNPARAPHSGLLRPARHRARRPGAGNHRGAEDRKSTRLNSSHVKISYAVFCLKKKKKKE